jgi:hypothetical protein
LFSVTGFDVSLRPRLAHAPRANPCFAPRPGRLRGDMKPTEKVGLGWPAICSLERAAGIESMFGVLGEV